MIKLGLILIVIAATFGCSTHSVPGGGSSTEKNGWMTKGNFLFGNELFYCLANDMGSKAEPNCYSSKYFYRR